MKKILKKVLYVVITLVVVIVFLGIIMAYIPTKSKVDHAGISPEKAAELRQDIIAITSSVYNNRR